MSQKRNNRVDELEALRQTTLAIASPADRDEVLKTIVTQATTLLRAESGGIYEYNPDTAQLTLICDTARPWAVGKSLPAGNGFAGRLAEGTSSSLIVNDYENWEGRSSFPAENELRQAVIGSPLIWQNKTLGVIFLNDKRQRQFSSEDAQLLKLFADHAALAYVNARRLDDVKKANQNAASLAELIVLGDLEKTLSSVARSVHTGLDCDAVELYVYNQVREEWSIPTLQGLQNCDNVRPTDAGSLVNRVLQTGESHFVDDLKNHPFLHDDHFWREGVVSTAAISLNTVGRRVGVMFINYRRSHRFSDEEISRIRLFANHAAIAIRNAQLYDEQTQQVKAQDALLELSQYLLGTVDRQEILNAAVSTATQLLGVEFCSIVLPDADGNLVVSAVYGWEPELIGNLRLRGGRGSQTGFTIETRRAVIVEDYATEDRFDVAHTISKRHIRSGLSVPISRAAKIVGALLVHTKSKWHFTSAEVNYLTLIGNETAIALERAEEFERSNKRRMYLEALYQSSKELSARFSSTPKQVLQIILDLAINALTSSDGKRPSLGTIQLYNEETNELVLESVYPPEAHPQLVQRIKERRSLDRKIGEPIGITGLAVLEGQPLLVNAARSHPEYVVYDEHTRSELAVPLRSGPNVIGVLSVESNYLEAFDFDDRAALVAFSDLAVIAIENVRQYNELKQTKGLVGARTALASMGMMSSMWQHSLYGNVLNIQNLVFLMRTKLSRSLPLESLESDLSRIDTLVERIKSSGIKLPLSSEEGVESIRLDQFVRGRIRRLMESGEYNNLKFVTNIPVDQELIVRASSEWLRHLIDPLIDNARVAMRDSEIRQITISVRRSGKWADITINDTGTGIPPEIQSDLFLRPIRSAPGGRGLGMGLLMVSAIAEAYGGKVFVGATSPQGTDMVVRLPLDN